MGVYNINYTGTMPPLGIGKTITLRENISSLVEISNTKNLNFLVRGRKTNFTRVFQATPTVGDFDSPQFVNNKRFWTINLTHIYPTSGSISAYDNEYYRKNFGFLVAPVMETYDIDLYYGDGKSLNLSSFTKIEGVDIVLNITVDKDYNNIETNNPVSSYTQYSENDVVDITPTGSTGQPTSSQEELNAQYGTQIWEV